MNRHNFVQFSPNSYKKHLSPFGQNVLDNLIKHWRTGFDNKESHHRLQLMRSEDRRNTREINGDNRPIPSVPSSPTGEADYEREVYETTNNFVTNNYYMPKVSTNKDYFERDTYQANRFINDNYGFAMPRVPCKPPEPSASICHETQKNNVQMQHNGVRNGQRQNYNNALPDIPIHQTLRGSSNYELQNAPIPVFDELIKTIEIADTNEEEILTANDMITPVIKFDTFNKNLLSSRKCFDKIDNSKLQPMQFLEMLNEETDKNTIPSRDEVITKTGKCSKKDVEWDDMFDTELFSNIGPEQLMMPLKADRRNDFQIEFPKDKMSKEKKSDTNLIKRKTQTKICDTLPKKVKKAICKENNKEISKQGTRKVKYTKVVKNWLDDVDLNHLVNKKIHQYRCSDMIMANCIPINVTNAVKGKYDVKSKVNIKNKLPSNLLPSSENEAAVIQKSEALLISPVENLFNQRAKEANQPETTILDETVTIKPSANIVMEKTSKGKNKKVVQARLAQKDGKMKFGPPAKEQKESNSKVTEENETKSNDTVKAKKVKPKFVAPIKSQIPVKNFTFNVTTIDENNIQLIQNLIESKDNEIAMILTFSNGFCQLNNHHAEETCVPEGIMIQSHDRYFFFKDNDQNSFSDLLRQLLEKTQVICYNGKRLLVYLNSKYDIELKQDNFNWIDAKIGGSLMDSDNPPENFAELQKLIGFTPEFTIATECVLQKAAWYTTLLRECLEKLKILLIENSVWNVFVEIEMRLLPVIAGMENGGVCVDLEKIKSMEEIVLTKMKIVEQECYKAAGKTFQINSALQVRTILYDELQLDTKSNLKIKETIGKGAKSTSETMLRGLVSVHALPRLILEYRHLHKAHATFLTGIAQHVKDGLVKPTWVQTAAATGRIASNNPNLQAIPKAPFSLVMFPETSDGQEPPLKFRSVYTARAQHWLVAADFKHVECRVFAHAAADATLLDALRSDDLFRVLAAKWLNKSEDLVSSEDRERTKRIVYASLYGAGARKLMEILQVGYEQALSIAASFNRTFPALRAFAREVAARAELRTPSGRARRLPPAACARAARQAVNFVVQGSAADLCKKAMVAVQRRLEQPPAVRGRLVLQIHDELVWEVAEDDVDRAAAIIKETMENVGVDCGMDMALPVELTRGRNWGEMLSFTPWASRC